MEREQTEQLLRSRIEGERFIPTAPPEPDARSALEPPVQPADPLLALPRIERLLTGMSDRLEALTRERQHRDFSLARLIGWVLQFLVVGSAIAAVADWAFQAELGKQLVMLMFAGVFQLGALTAFVLSRE
jgi:hypothetical protein